MSCPKRKTIGPTDFSLLQFVVEKGDERQTDGEADEAGQSNLPRPSK